uniref:Transmembrane protein n=1 Tax=Haemonchus contortus TaxID=6289 RepID=A0A7I4YKF1_HAECO
RHSRSVSISIMKFLHIAIFLLLLAVTSAVSIVNVYGDKRLQYPANATKHR